MGRFFSCFEETARAFHWSNPWNKRSSLLSVLATYQYLTLDAAEVKSCHDTNMSALHDLPISPIVLYVPVQLTALFESRFSMKEATICLAVHLVAIF